MIKTELKGPGITTTVLGFGCAGLMRASSAKRRRAVLDAAFDSGIRHFDVARMYGLGQAEYELGKFAAGRRDKVVLVTKFGIEVNEATTRVALLQGLARQVIRLVPPLRRLARRRAGALYVPRNYAPTAAQKSLEASLRALRTDYVDIFFLHEPVLDKVENTGIHEFLEKARDRGDIRAWGLAGYPEQVGPVGEAFPGLATVMQVPNDVVGRQLDQFRQLATAFITFSPFAQARQQVAGLVKGSPLLAARWSAQLDIDITDVRNLNALLLSWCLADNSGGVVLFSSGNKDHIKEAANLVNDDKLSSKAVLFGQLVQSELAATGSG